MKFIDKILTYPDVYFTTNWQMIQWMRDPTPNSQLANFEPFRCDTTNLSADGKFKFSVCNHANVCNLRSVFELSALSIRFKLFKA